MQYLVLAENLVCETPSGCDKPATSMVWVSHHSIGCGYTGYRCDIHLNLLYREVVVETTRLSRAIEEGRRVMCMWCQEIVEDTACEDHLRWFRL